MRTLSTLLNEITKITEWYRGRPEHMESTRKNIDALLKARRILACNLVELATFTADAKEARDAAVFARKSSVAKKVLEYRSEGMTISESEHKSNLDAETHREIERGCEHAYEQSKLIYSSVNDVLNALAGDINILSNEFKKANYND